jgi:hypothetical protein
VTKNVKVGSRSTLRLSATLLFAGVLISVAAGLFHPANAPANNHAAAFADYAASVNWTTIHLGQFVGMTGIDAGLVALFVALEPGFGTRGLVGRWAVASVIVALALYGLLQAIDGVALKQAANAWATAGGSEKSIRFASAETIRWLEWGARSYQSLMLGLSLVLFASVLVAADNISSPISYLMGLSGFAYLIQGWIIGMEGFSAGNEIAIVLSIILNLIWSAWLLIDAWRMDSPQP